MAESVCLVHRRTDATIIFCLLLLAQMGSDYKDHYAQREPYWQPVAPRKDVQLPCRSPNPETEDRHEADCKRSQDS